ncbi:MAG: phosphodiesterase [Endozoicomonas sp. (ex Botrylloides leachii)]|nr:phosphodiesterase [Endozoicomonas sp. (ex Botrylloides leachii)]
MLFNFIHISDTQLLPQGKRCYGIDPFERLKRCIADIQLHCPEAQACIVTGDLAHAGEVLAYEQLQKALLALDMPAWLLLGNHDITALFCRVFGVKLTNSNGYVQFSHSTPAGRFIGLDTHRDNQRSGHLCPWQLEWLDNQLRISESAFLFMHHPPFPVGLPFMDDDNLVNGNDLLQVIQRHSSTVRHLFFGHLHRAVSGNWQGISYSCPFSLVHQSPFDFTSQKITALSAESPQYHHVHLYQDRIMIHARDFLNSGLLMRN